MTGLSAAYSSEKGSLVIKPSSTDPPSYIAAYCKVCNTRVTPKAKFAGRRIKCPDCFSPIQLPTVEEYVAQKKQVKVGDVATPQEHSPYDLQAPVERTEPVRTEFAQKQSKIRHVRKKPKPPKWTFFSNVFEFPWSDTETLIRWAMMSGGLSITGVIAVLNYWLVTENGLMGMIPVVFLLLAQFGIGAWSMSYASSCGFSIIHDTSAGLNKVEGWPEGGVREWMIDMMTVVGVFFSSGFVSWLIASPIAQLTSHIGPPVLIIHLFLFPLALISALDADSIILPYSELTLRSIPRITWAWLLFYGLLAGVWLTAAVFLTPLLVFIPVLFGIAAGPVFGAGFMISARLLGRLAWLIGEDASRDEHDDGYDNE